MMVMNSFTCLLIAFVNITIARAVRIMLDELYSLDNDDGDDDAGDDIEDEDEE